MTLEFTCTVCAGPMLPHRRFRGALTCGQWRCERQLRDRHLEADRAEVAAATALAGVGDAPWVELPANEQPIVASSDGRRQAFEGHLRTLVDEVWCTDPELPPAPAESGPELEAESEPTSGILRSACATCRGHCCETGQDHAHLDVGAIARQRVLLPRLTKRDAVAGYLARLPARSVRGSCIFHGETGCTLPRTMRSDLCNTYRCSGLLALSRQHAVEEGTSLLAAKAGLRLVRARVVDERGETIAEFET